MKRVTKPQNLMKIGELAERTGVSHRTIHYYERLGLLKPHEREGAGYRYFDDEAAQRLEKIGALKKIGLSLDEIATVIDLYFEDPTGIRGKRRVLEILKCQLDETDNKLTELGRFRSDIETNIAKIESLIQQSKR